MTTQCRKPRTGTAPDLLTVEEAAWVLRIGRTKAYELVRRWFATDGADGLPAVRVGHQVRVLRYGLEELIGGPITWPIPIEDPASATTPAPITAIDTPRSARRSRRRSSRSVAADAAAAVLGATDANYPTALLDTSRYLTDRCPPAADVRSGVWSGRLRDVAGVDSVRVVGGGDGRLLHPVSDGGAGGAAGRVVGPPGRRVRARRRGDRGVLADVVGGP